MNTFFHRYIKRDANVRVSSFLLIVVLLLACTHVSSQNFQGGILGGITTSQVDGDEHSGFHKLGCLAGIYVMRSTQSSLPNHIFELTFSQKGASFPETNTTQKFAIEIGYVDATYVCDIVPNNYFKKFPQYTHFQIGSSVSTKVYENAFIADVKQSSNDFNRLDWQLQLGICQQIGFCSIELHALHSIIPNSGKYYNFAVNLGLRVNLLGN